MNARARRLHRLLKTIIRLEKILNTAFEALFEFVPVNGFAILTQPLSPTP
jgi:hypothetical protein